MLFKVEEKPCGNTLSSTLLSVGSFVPSFPDPWTRFFTNSSELEYNLTVFCKNQNLTASRRYILASYHIKHDRICFVSYFTGTMVLVRLSFEAIIMAMKIW